MLFSNAADALTNHRIVMRDGEKQMSASDLYQEACKLATYLQEKGMRPGDRVLIAVPSGIEFIRLIYALIMTRALVAIIDPEMGRANYLKKLEQLQPQHAFIDSRLVLLNEHPIARFLLLRLSKQVPNIPRIKNCQLFAVGMWLPILQKHQKLPKLGIQEGKIKPKSTSWTAAVPEDDALIIYTSGTLNEPKGVVHTTKSIDRSLELLAQLLSKGVNQRIATHLPHFILLGINAGLEVLTWDNTLSPAKKLAFIEKHQITTLFGPPADFLPLLHYLERHNATFPSCLENIYLGSAPLYTAFLEKILARCGQTQVTCLYGMTENLMVCHQNAREKVSLDGEGDLVGTPFEGVRLQIADDGEVMLQSDQLFKGYDRMGSHDGTHATGDLGRIDEHGRLWLLGRKKDMIIRRNFNLYPGLYEPTIHQIPGVHAAAMVGVYKEELADEEVFLVIEGDSNLQATQVMSLLQEGPFAIDREALPDQILFLKLPRSGRQLKVDKNALRTYCTTSQTTLSPAV